MVNEPDITDNQSAFSTAQAVLSEPPEIKEQKNKRSKLKIALIGSGIFLLAVLTLIAIAPPRSPAPTSSPSPTPTGSPTISDPSPLQQTIQQMQSDTRSANPNDVQLPPPQVDMDVNF